LTPAGRMEARSTRTCKAPNVKIPRAARVRGCLDTP